MIVNLTFSQWLSRECSLTEEQLRVVSLEWEMYQNIKLLSKYSRLWINNPRSFFIAKATTCTKASVKKLMKTAILESLLDRRKRTQKNCIFLRKFIDKHEEHGITRVSKHE